MQRNTCTHTHTHTCPSSLLASLIFSWVPCTVFLFFLSFNWSHLWTICSPSQRGLRPPGPAPKVRVCVCQWTTIQSDNPPPHTHPHTSNNETLNRDQSVGIFQDGCWVHGGVRGGWNSCVCVSEWRSSVCASLYEPRLLTSTSLAMRLFLYTRGSGP